MNNRNHIRMESDYVMDDAAIVSGSETEVYANYDSSSSENNDDDASSCCSMKNINNNDDGDNNDNLAMMQVSNNEGMQHQQPQEEESKNQCKKEAEYKKHMNITADPLYNPNGDDEDEAYVYKHLRSGIEEHITIKKKKSQEYGQTSQLEQIQQLEQQHQQHHQEQQLDCQLEQAKILKPRKSDGILSCPCCFQIVCMDCQKHEQYSNQFRAMFVMNIGVDWDEVVTPYNDNNHKNYYSSRMCDSIGSNDKDYNGDVYEDQDIVDQAEHQFKKQKLQENDDDHNNNYTTNNDHQKKKKIPTDEEHNAHEAFVEKENEDVYYSVYCNSCRTQVAALDMRDEVYYFFGCILSG